jgi:hypothetical protein
MTIPAAADSHGSTFTFSGFVAHITGINPPTLTRKPIDSTHLGSSTVMESIPSKLYDAGEVSVDCEFDPASVPPIGGTEASLAIYFAATVPVTWTWARAIMTSFKIGPIKSGDKFTASASFKLSSVPQIS